MFELIPLPYRIAGAALAAVAVFGAGWWKGSAHTQSAWDAAKEAQAATIAKVEVAQAQATVKVVTQYVDRVQVIKEKADAVIREVPIYLHDAAPVDGRIGVLVNAAESGGPVPDATGSANAPAVAAEAVAIWSVDTVRDCEANSAQLVSLQDWIRAQQAAAGP